MLELITKYLVQNKRVCIPHIGTFEIVQQPPQLDIADKLFTAPVFTTKYSRQDNVAEHQFESFTIDNFKTKEELRQELDSFGKNLKSKIQQSPFEWAGFGTLYSTEDTIVFEPQKIELPALQSIPAEKVIRPNKEHHVLVGDQETSKVFHAVEQTNHILKANKRSLTLTIGLTLLVLAIIGIIVILYLGDFSITASGLKLKPAGNSRILQY